MNKVIIPDRLAKIAKLNSKEHSSSGTTVNAVLTNLCEHVDQLRDHFFHTNGEFKNHFMVIVNEEHASLDDKVSDGAVIEVVLATSGGIDISPVALSKDEVERYSRHLLLPDVGRKGQGKLKACKVLIIGTGGLGSPISLYLAAAGVGTVGLIDFDTVDESNLQRQIVHGHSTVGVLKVESAKARLLDLNKHLKINIYAEALNPDNAFDIISDYDIVIDGSDNFTTRYLINDACVLLDKPLVSGSIHQFDGQVSVFNYEDGPCYRCAFPNSPPPELSPNCSAGGVIGVLPGIVGTIQSAEAVKIILGLGKTLSGKLLRFDALEMSFSKVGIKKKPDCTACSNKKAISLFKHQPQSCHESSIVQHNLSQSDYIQAEELHELLEQDLDENNVILDVRNTTELEICALPNAINIPLDEIHEVAAELDKSKTYFVVCLGGRRAENAATILKNGGFRNVRVLTGGMKAWVKNIDKEMPIY